MANDKIKLTGVIEEIFPGSKFKVKLENDVLITCTLSGKMKVNSIRVLPGDKVDVELSPYDLTQGIISYRHK
ncbi:translation initiation factor IF-1 [bacterium]|nr:translation initiation factor IF-1 [bacterium]MBR2652201.1 translation initiation factor IF-1 [bacterium]